MEKKAILKKTIQFGSFTFISRILGIIREILQIRFLGISAMSDAFITAFRIPNVLRKVFAEGALSSASIPVLEKLQRKNDQKLINSTMSATFLFFEGIVGLICLFAFLFPSIIVKVIAPGFSAEQISYAIPFVRILFPFIFFISSCALLAAALQSIYHFFAQAFGPIILNIFYVSSLLTCLYFNKDILFLSKGIILGGAANFLFHLILYFTYNFNFGKITRAAIEQFKLILKKFLPCLLGVGIVEINMFADTMIVSFLPIGSTSLLTYATRFIQMPVGMFAVGFATILLPYFSRIVLYAPKRLKFHLLETTKFVTWVVAPTMFFLMFVSEKLFFHLFSGKATVAQIIETKFVLIVYATGLVFFSLNKVLVNIFYSLKDTTTPTIGASIAAVVNFVCNIIGVYFWGSYGIATGTVISGLTLTIFCFVYLNKKHDVIFYGKKYLSFLYRYVFQLATSVILFYISHFFIFKYLQQTPYSDFFTAGLGYWLFTIPLFLLTMVFMFFTKRLYKIKIYFLDI